MALFAQYAMAASQEALEDASWHPKSDEDLEATVCDSRPDILSVADTPQGVYIGSGIGSFDEVFETSIAYEKGGYRKVSPLFVPRLLINLAAGHISMRFGLKVCRRPIRRHGCPLTFYFPGTKSCGHDCLHDWCSRNRRRCSFHRLRRCRRNDRWRRRILHPSFGYCRIRPCQKSSHGLE